MPGSVRLVQRLIRSSSGVDCVVFVRGAFLKHATPNGTAQELLGKEFMRARQLRSKELNNPKAAWK